MLLSVTAMLDEPLVGSPLADEGEDLGRYDDSLEIGNVGVEILFHDTKGVVRRSPPGRGRLRLFSMIDAVHEIPGLVVGDGEDRLGDHLLEFPGGNGKERALRSLGKFGKFLARDGLELEPDFLESRLDDDLGIILLDRRCRLREWWREFRKACRRRRSRNPASMVSTGMTVSKLTLISVALRERDPSVASRRTLDIIERAFLEAMISWAKDISRAKEFFSQVNFIEYPLHADSVSELLSL